MRYKIEIGLKKGFRDQHGEHILHDIKDLGVTSVSGVSYYPVFAVDGDVSRKDIETISAKLLIDPVTEEYRINHAAKPSSVCHEIEVWFKPGVTDTVAGSVIKAVNDIGISKPITVKTGQKFVITGRISRPAVRQLSERLLVNPMIQTYTIK